MTFSDDPRRNDPPKREKQGKWKKRPRPVFRSKFVLPKLPRGQRWYGPRIVYDWHTQLSTGEPLGLDIQGFKFDDSDAARWELVPREMEVITLARLLQEFRQHWRWFQKPIVFARNPEKEGKFFFGEFTDMIICVYPRGFHITIERYGREIYGPHAARLFYRSSQDKTEVAWVAICQLNVFWHSDERVLAALNSEIKNRRLWQSPETSRQVVLQ